MMLPEDYTGKRILEAMHEAKRYSASVFALIKRAMPGNAMDIAEIGAGDGAFAGMFQRERIRVDCVEPDRLLQRRLQALPGDVFADSRSLASDRYDFIYSVNVLEHIAEPERELAELRRALRSGGVFFVFVPAFRLLWTSLDDEVGHVTRFTRAELKNLLQRSGFAVRSIYYFDSLGFPAALAVRFLETLRLFRYSSGSVRLYDRAVFPISRVLDGGLRHVVGKNLVAVAVRASKGAALRGRDRSRGKAAPAPCERNGL